MSLGLDEGLGFLINGGGGGEEVGGRAGEVGDLENREDFGDRGRCFLQSAEGFDESGEFVVDDGASAEFHCFAEF